MENYLPPLPEDVGLQVFFKDELIFTSKNKWLIPLFELENFLNTKNYDPSQISLHDKISGKAAAVLTLRLGIKKVNIDLISQLAIDYYAINELSVKYNKLATTLICQTEILLKSETNVEKMYSLLVEKAKLSGVQIQANKASLGFDKNILFEN